MYKLKRDDGVVVITGGSSGIGEELVCLLEFEGYKVVTISRRPSPYKLYYQCDVTNREQMKETITKIINEHGNISLLIANAGGGIHTNQDWFGDKFRETFDLNFNGTLNTLEFVVPQMIKQGYGHIAIMSSVSGYGGLPYLNSAYTTAKSALIHLAESMHWKLCKRNVRVQIICPGFVDTPLNDSSKIHLPFLMDKNKAARIIRKGLKSKRFEIYFPKATTAKALKLLNLLPYPLYFRAVKLGLLLNRVRGNIYL